MRHGRIIGAVVATLGAVALQPASAAGDEVIVVSTTTDEPGLVCVSGVSCSLRGAVNQANSDDDADVIAILADNTYTLTLGTQLVVTKPVTIVSTGTARNTVVKGAGSRAFKTSADTVMAGFTIREGNGKDGGVSLTPTDDRGGGIWQEAGNLILANVRITANQVDNAVAATGGAIHHEGAGTLLLASSLVDANTAKAGAAAGQLGRGGGVFAAASSGAVTVASATLTANTAAGAAGSQGGGVATEAGSSVALVNATVSANAASGLGGNVAPGGPVSALNTIVSAGTAPSGANCSGVLASQGNNLEPGTSCGLAGAGDRNADPALAPLADNGGPTDTFAIGTGSAAFDAGSDAGCPQVDQRGQKRPQGLRCEIGAFEVANGPPPAGAGSVGTGSGSGGARDPAPALRKLAVAPNTFRAASVGARSAARRPPVGSRVSHTLSEAATVAYLVERGRPGRRRGRTCAAPTRANRRARACVRWSTLPGAFARTGTAGANRFRFAGRLAGRALGPGRYRLMAVARDTAGNVSNVARREFRVVRR